MKFKQYCVIHASYKTRLIQRMFFKFYSSSSYARDLRATRTEIGNDIETRRKKI